VGTKEAKSYEPRARHWHLYWRHYECKQNK
jgi:hypothetical protein